MVVGVVCCNILDVKGALLYRFGGQLCYYVLDFM